MIRKLKSRLSRARQRLADGIFNSMDGSDWNYPSPYACERIIGQMGLCAASCIEVAGQSAAQLSTHEGTHFSGPDTPADWNCTQGQIAQLQSVIKRMPDFADLPLTDAHIALLSNLIVRYATEFSAYPYQAFRSSTLQPGDTFVDIGAFRGYVALKAARKVGADGNVLAFEPMASNHAFVEAHKALNNLDNLKIIQSVVSDDPATDLPFFTETNQRNALVADHLTGDMAQTTVNNTSAQALVEMVNVSGHGRVCCSVTTNGTEMALTKSLIDHFAEHGAPALEITLPVIYTRSEVAEFVASLGNRVGGTQLAYPWLKLWIRF